MVFRQGDVIDIKVVYCPTAWQVEGIVTQPVLAAGGGVTGNQRQVAIASVPPHHRQPPVRFVWV